MPDVHMDSSHLSTSPMKLADEDTKAATGRKPPAPGKKWVRVVKTKMSMEDGYMQAEDYSSYEE